jgi:hypothetical protein
VSTLFTEAAILAFPKAELSTQFLASSSKLGALLTRLLASTKAGRFARSSYAIIWSAARNKSGQSLVSQDFFTSDQDLVKFGCLFSRFPQYDCLSGFELCIPAGQRGIAVRRGRIGRPMRIVREGLEGVRAEVLVHDRRLTLRK